MQRLFWIALAGALGTGARYLIGTWAGRALGTTFPFGTLIVNCVGCFLIGCVMQVSLSTTLVPPALRLTLATGFIGGLTTYSSFNYETLRLVEDGAWRTAFANFTVTTFGCAAAGILGLVVARRLFGT